MLCEVPLTKEQQDFAAANHGLVYKFLNDNCLSEDEFYDVVIFAYLKAVRDYFSDKTAQQYLFPAIAKYRMRLSVVDYYRAQFRQKRRAEIISIQLEPYSGSRSLEELLSVQEDIPMQDLEMSLLLHDLAGRISQQQMNIVRLKRNGYGIWEISSREKIPMKRIKEILEEVRIVFLEMCRE